MTDAEAQAIINFVAGLRQLGDRMAIALEAMASALQTANAVLDRAEELARAGRQDLPHGG